MLISQFYKITGVPNLLNTSFNENEPKNAEEMIEEDIEGSVTTNRNKVKISIC